MSRKYKFHNKEGIYFVSFAVVNWVDIFTRRAYQDILTESLKYCIQHKGMELYCWCLMPNHVHLIFSAINNNPSELLGRFKEFTAKQVIKAIEENHQESRKEWLLKVFEEAAKTSSNVKARQFWQHHNKPIELWSNGVIDQKADYIHNNPINAGFVDEAEYWRHSSAIDYSGGKGILPIVLLW